MVRAFLGVAYWAVVGLLSLFGLYVSVLGNLPLYLLLIPTVLALFGTWSPGLRYSGSLLVVFGGYPALLISGAVLGQIFNSDWSCSRVAFDGIGNPNGGTSGCTTVSINLILFAVALWLTTLLGIFLLYLLLRARPQTDGRRARLGAKELAAILLAVAAFPAFYAAIFSASSKAQTAAPSPPERAGLPSNGLSVSCSEGEEEIGVFNGVGDDIIPEFEVIGEGWRYAYASTGTGAFSIEVLDENGNPVPSSAVSGEAGDEGRGPRIEAQGTFSLTVDADDEVGHTLLACDETHPSSRKQRRHRSLKINRAQAPRRYEPARCPSGTSL